MSSIIYTNLDELTLGEQRLFIHHEYVVNENLRESAADSADRLKEIWKIAPIPPVQITYHSAFLNQTQNYIDNSFRHPTFEKLNSYKDAMALIEQSKLPNPSQLLASINQHPDDAYYTLRYRQNDNNVVMRLRAWGLKVEVIFPQELRQRMRQDLEQTWQLYQDPSD